MRRNRPQRRRRQKSKGKARPSSWHRGPNRDRHLAEAQRRFAAAERSAA